MNEAHITLPVLTIYGTGTVPCREECLVICTELSSFASTQYNNFNFNSMCKFGDNYLGCNELGIFKLDGDTYNNIQIDAFFELLLSDFGIINQKRVRELYIGYETSGSLIFTLKTDDGNEKTYVMTAKKGNQRQHGGKIRISRIDKGRYWALKIENVDGCDFSVDSIKGMVIVHEKEP